MMGGFNPFGMFGETDTQFQAKNATHQAQKQWQVAQQQLGQQQQYAGQAGNVYNQLLGYGQQDRNLMTQNLGPLMNIFSQAAGVPYQLQGTGQPGQAGQQGLGQQMAKQAGAGGKEQRQRAPGGAGQPGGGAAGQQTMANQMAQTASGQVAQQAQASNDMWGLTQAQGVELNSQMQAYSQAEASALQDFRTSYLARGMTPPAEGEAMIKQQYSNQALVAQANFAEQARANRQAAAQQMLSMVLGLGQQGASEVGAAGQGYANLGGQAANLSTSFAGLGQGSQQLALQASQATQASQDALVGGAMNMLGFGLGGGFNKTKSPNIFNYIPTSSPTGDPGIGGGTTQGPGQPAPVTGLNVPAFNPADILANFGKMSVSNTGL